MTSLDVNKEALLQLADRTHPHSISLFIPTHSRGREVLEGQDQILFKNHLQAIRLELEAQQMRSNDIDDLMLPLEDLLNDVQFWRHRTAGLAVFRSPAYFETFDSPVPLDDFYQLSDSFFVRPLLPYVQSAPEYYLLQIGKNGVILYQADPYSISVVNTQGVMPADLNDVTKYYDFEEELQGRTKGRGGMTAVYTSEDSDNKEKDHLLADYFRLIDEAIIQLIGTRNVPLLLASVEYYQPIYRQVNAYPHLHEGGLTGNFDHVDLRELHEMANEQLRDYFNRPQQERISQYQHNSGGDLVSRDLRLILEAAVTGRVEVLFVQQDGEAWGQFDEATLTATLHDEAQPGDMSLIDQAALLTLRNGGEVYVLDEVALLADKEPVAITALFRF